MNFDCNVFLLRTLINKYAIGEYTMLMLGESILSLLVVNNVSETSEVKYYFTFYMGIVSVSLIQYLFYKSQPHSPEHHGTQRREFSHLFAY